jgi:hypothetical protein
MADDDLDDEADQPNEDGEDEDEDEDDEEDDNAVLPAIISMACAFVGGPFGKFKGHSVRD